MDELRNLVIELLDRTDPFPSALEERVERDVGGLWGIWERLAECVGYTRSADEGSPTTWDKQ